MAITMDMAAMHTMGDMLNMAMVHIMVIHTWQKHTIHITAMEPTTVRMVLTETKTTIQSNNNENRSRF